jgi:hypothetical protein
MVIRYYLLSSSLNLKILQSLNMVEVHMPPLEATKWTLMSQIGVNLLLKKSYAHVVNLEDFVPGRIQIRGFGGSIWAEGRGTIVVWATAPGDKEKSQELRI